MDVNEMGFSYYFIRLLIEDSKQPGILKIIQCNIENKMHVIIYREYSNLDNDKKKKIFLNYIRH